MHFSLRTLLAVITAVAIYDGCSLGIIRTLNGPRGVGAIDSYYVTYMLFGLPVFVLWVVAAVWAFERRDRPGMKLLLWGLVLTATWRHGGPLAMAAFEPPGMGGPNQQILLASFWFFDALVQTASWALLFYAFVKASKSRPTPVSPWEEPQTIRRGEVAKNND